LVRSSAVIGRIRPFLGPGPRGVPGLGPWCRLGARLDAVRDFETAGNVHTPMHTPMAKRGGRSSNASSPRERSKAKCFRFGLDGGSLNKRTSPEAKIFLKCSV
jgi:hypothetical protein